MYLENNREMMPKFCPDRSRAWKLTPSTHARRMDDREWMYTGYSSLRSMTNEWIQKTDAFLELAFANVKGAQTTWCPCGRCGNTRQQTKEVMGKHLCKNGFTTNYTQWTYHGEASRERDETSFSLSGCTEVKDKTVGGARKRKRIKKSSEPAACLPSKHDLLHLKSKAQAATSNDVLAVEDDPSGLQEGNNTTV